MSENTFTWKRFGQFLRWDFMHNRRSYSRFVGGLGIGLAIVYTLQLFGCLPFVRQASGWEEAQDWYMAHVEQWGSVTAVIIGVLAVVWGVYIPAQLKTKTGGIAFLMVPASRLEKYLGRLLATLAVSLVGGLLATLAADAVHALLSLALADGHVGSLTWATLRSLCSSIDVAFSVSTAGFDAGGELGAMGGVEWPPLCAWLSLGYAVVLFLHASYVLGGLLFNRNALLLTTVCHFVLWCVVVPMLLAMCALRMEVGAWGLGAWVWLLVVLFVLLALGCHLLAFRLLSRRQVVRHGVVSA